jgi:hypothetical protein
VIGGAGETTLETLDEMMEMHGEPVVQVGREGKQ